MLNILIFTILSIQTNINLINDKINFHTKMADKYYHFGEFPNMIYHLQQKIKLDPHDVNSYSDISYYYWSMSINEENRREEFENKALNILKLGLEKNKNSAYMYDEIANFYFRYKKYELAMPYLLDAIKFKDCPMTAYHMLSLAYLKKQETKKAIEVLSECVKKFPNDAKAKSKIKELQSVLNGG